MNKEVGRWSITCEVHKIRGCSKGIGNLFWEGGL